jgi:hypothetical protein
MTLAERIYRVVLWLYPSKHRQAYEEPMLQHARDMGHAARRRGPWHVAVLCLRLLKDGVVNGAIERLEVIGMADNRYTPTPWLSVILAAFPGLLIAVSRRHTAQLEPLQSVVGFLYLGLLVIAPPIIWWKRRRIPAWALLPAGIVVWSLTYMAGSGLWRLVDSLRIPGLQQTGSWMWIPLVNLLLAAALFVVLLRGRRVPGPAWLVAGIMVFGNVLVAVLYSLAEFGGTELYSGVVWYLIMAGCGPTEGLMLVAVGLLAARQHGVLAILIVIGGYSFMCLDTDHLIGYRHFLEWAGLPAYLVAVTVSFLVVGPVTLLRARTRLGRALAVFAPVVVFHVARLMVPLLVIEQVVKLRPGDVIMSINAVLSLALAWALYSPMGDTLRGAQPSGRLDPSPSPS